MVLSEFIKKALTMWKVEFTYQRHHYEKHHRKDVIKQIDTFENHYIMQISNNRKYTAIPATGQKSIDKNYW